MFRQSVIPLESESEWRSALDGVPHGFGHTWESCYAVSLTTRLPTFLWHIEVDGVRIVYPYCERSYDGYVDVTKPFGFSGFVGSDRCPDLPRLWTNFARARQYVCGYLGLNPVFEAPGDFAEDEVLEYDAVHVLDLTLSEEELLSRSSKSRRRQVRKALEEAPVCTLSASAMAAFFVEHFDTYMDRKGASAVYRFSRETLEFLCGLENVHMEGSSYAGNVAAVDVFGYTPYGADSLFYVSADEVPNFSSVHIGRGMRALRERRVPILNLGGGHDSIQSYKASFGGAVKPLRCVRQVYDSVTYRALCEKRGVDEGARNYFPAYRAPA